jgi:hypothetical protein
MGEILHRNTKGSGKTEISKLQDAFSVYEKILRFKISVQNFVLVALCYSI